VYDYPSDVRKRYSLNDYIPHKHCSSY